MAIINVEANTGQIMNMRITAADLQASWDRSRNATPADLRPALLKYWGKAERVELVYQDGHGVRQISIVKERSRRPDDAEDMRLKEAFKAK